MDTLGLSTLPSVHTILSPFILNAVVNDKSATITESVVLVSVDVNPMLFDSGYGVLRSKFVITDLTCDVLPTLLPLGYCTVQPNTLLLT